MRHGARQMQCLLASVCQTAKQQASFRLACCLLLLLLLAAACCCLLSFSVGYISAGTPAPAACVRLIAPDGSTEGRQSTRPATCVSRAAMWWRGGRDNFGRIK